MKSNADLTPKNIRRLSEEIQKLTKPRLKHYLENTGAIKYHGEGGSSKRDRLLHTLEEGNGTEEIRRFLSVIIREEFERSDARVFQEAFAGSRFVVEKDPKHGLRILMDHAAVTQDEIETHESYLEKHAPKQTLNEFRGAREQLAHGDNPTSLYKCRMALDSLTNCGFGEALDQLHSNNLIKKIDPQSESPYTNKVREYRLLYAAWSWTSWLGSHTNKKGLDVTDSQAEIGLVLTGEVLYYIIQILKKNKSENLDKWADV